MATSSSGKLQLIICSGYKSLAANHQNITLPATGLGEWEGAGNPTGGEYKGT